jgi:hypothetical protein
MWAREHTHMHIYLKAVTLCDFIFVSIWWQRICIYRLGFSGLWHWVVLQMGCQCFSEHTTSIFRVHFNPEGVGNTFFCNIANCLQDYTVTWPRRSQLTSLQSWEPQISDYSNLIWNLHDVQGAWIMLYWKWVEFIWLMKSQFNCFRSNRGLSLTYMKFQFNVRLSLTVPAVLKWKYVK